MSTQVKLYIYKLSGYDQIISSVIMKAWCTCNFIDHLSEAYKQYVCTLFR